MHFTLLSCFMLLIFVFVFLFIICTIFFWCRYTAVGVFVLGRMFREAWGTEASKKQAEFNDFLEVIS